MKKITPFLKLFFVLCIIAYFLLINSQGNLKIWKFSQSFLGIGIKICSLVGMLYFVLDSFQRRFKTSKGLAVGLAIGGFFSLGIASLLYYIFWGRFPINKSKVIFNDHFCEDCMTSTSEKSAGDTIMINAIFGGRLLGNSKVCVKCGSAIQTIWFFIGSPIFPMGSYRVLYVTRDHYISRKTKLDYSRRFI